MATHSSVLAWRIAGVGEPGGLLSMGSHRVGHNWCDLAAAATAEGRTWKHRWGWRNWGGGGALHAVRHERGSGQHLWRRGRGGPYPEALTFTQIILPLAQMADTLLTALQVDQKGEVLSLVYELSLISYAVLIAPMWATAQDCNSSCDSLTHRSRPSLTLTISVRTPPHPTCRRQAFGPLVFCHIQRAF